MLIVFLSIFIVASVFSVSVLFYADIAVIVQKNPQGGKKERQNRNDSHKVTAASVLIYGKESDGQ